MTVWQQREQGRHCSNRFLHIETYYLSHRSTSGSTILLMCTKLWNVISKLSLSPLISSLEVLCYVFKPGVRSVRTVQNKRLLKPFCVQSNVAGWMNTVNFRFKMKWQRVLPLRHHQSRFPWNRCESSFKYQSFLFLLPTNHCYISISPNYLPWTTLVILHLHFLIPPLVPGQSVKQGHSRLRWPDFQN